MGQSVKLWVPTMEDVRLVSSIEEMAARIKDIETIDRKECRSRAELLFDSKQMAKNYVALYRRLLGA